MAKKKEENVQAVENEELKVKFQEKLKELLVLGKKKKNILEYQEISDFFKELNLDAEKFEMVLDYLEHNGIDVLRMTDNDDDDDADIIFIKKKFLRGYVFGFRLNDSEKLNTKLLTARYNDKIKKNVYDMAVAINQSYFASFKAWEMSLNTVIEENITDYNPQLRDMAAMIKEETEKILELESDQNAISSSLEAIRTLMSWKDVE